MTSRAPVAPAGGGGAARAGADAVRLALVAGVLAWLALGREDTALMLAMTLPAVAAARLAGVPPVLDLVFVAAIALFSWGVAFGLLDAWPDADLVAHTALPFLLVLCVHAVLARRPGPAARRAVLLSLAVAVAWEVAEAGADAVAGTDFSPSARDAAVDLVAGAAGIAAGALWLRWRGRRRRGAAALDE